MLDKSVAVKKNINVRENDRDDLVYWLGLTAEERISAVEKLRVDFRGEDYEDKQGLSGIFKITRRK